MDTTHPTWADLLERAISEPGIVSGAYSAFWNYSLGNQLLALGQCHERGIQPGPLSTFNGWKDKGRHVRKGERALTLCMPITVKRQPDGAIDTESVEPGVFTTFVYRPRWFLLAQTDGAAYAPAGVPGWDRARALTVLNITEEPFSMFSGNVQGYARERTIAISPIAAMPEKTTFHEIAHVALGHTLEHEQADGEHTPRSLREVEAEAVAMLVCAALDLPGIEYCRGYIQAWNRTGEAIPERSAQRVFKVADQILRAGQAAGDVAS